MSEATDAFNEASTALASAVEAATVDPADAVRLLLPLCQWTQPATLGSGPMAAVMARWTNAVSRNMRCAALAALAVATSNYRPISYEDAFALRSTVCAAFEAEATLAADDGDDTTYLALRDLRAAVALDLLVRGASLPSLIEVRTLVSMPSLAEAWALYEDTSREPSLVASADPPHPLFLPLSFPALSF